jgi:hypothetical protein
MTEHERETVQTVSSGATQVGHRAKAALLMRMEYSKPPELSNQSFASEA